MGGLLAGARSTHVHLLTFPLHHTGPTASFKWVFFKKKQRQKKKKAEDPKGINSLFFLFLKENAENVHP